MVDSSLIDVNPQIIIIIVLGAKTCANAKPDMKRLKATNIAMKHLLMHFPTQ